MSNPKWPRRAEFVNMVLAWGVANSSINIEDVDFNGIAGEFFDHAIRSVSLDVEMADELIGMALKMGVPVKGLVADGELGEKWDEVVALCKQAA